MSQGVVEDDACAFGSEAIAPVGVGETPADFYDWVGVGREGRLKCGDVEADEPDEGAGGAKFGGPDAVVMVGEVGLDAGDEVVGFCEGERVGKVLHDAGVGVHLGEGDAVGGTPRAELETGCLESGHRRYGNWSSVMKGFMVSRPFHVETLKRKEHGGWC